MYMYIYTYTYTWYIGIYVHAYSYIYMLIAKMEPTGAPFQNPRSRNLGRRNKGTPTPKRYKQVQMGWGCPYFAEQNSVNAGFGMGPPWAPFLRSMCINFYIYMCIDFFSFLLLLCRICSHMIYAWYNPQICMYLSICSAVGDSPG